MSCAVWWVKRDARLADNEALNRALTAHERVLVLAIVEPSLFGADDASWLQYDAWRQAIDALFEEIRRRGGQALLKVGEAPDVFEALHARIGLEAVYAHEEIGTAATWARDRRVARWARESGLRLHEYPQSGVIRGLVDRGERQPIIKARLLHSAPLPAPSRLPPGAPDASLHDDAWPPWAVLNDRPAAPQAAHASQQPVSEAEGTATLVDFLSDRGEGYSGGISSPNTAFTHGSRLSVHIAWGTVSLRTLHQASAERLADAQATAKDGTATAAQTATAKRWAKSLRAFQARLHWHDHFSQRLESATWMTERTLNPAYRDVVYDDDGTHLAAWFSGHTGHPMVDASIRCLHATGFLNFRMRAMLVTVATFGLGIHWRDVQGPYAQLFRDYEPGIHYPQVQMQAGLVGINTLRVYSPAKQLLDQDPQTHFVRRWLPELQDCATADILAYDKRPLPGYVPPIDLAEGNARMKAQLYAIRRSDAGRAAADQVLLEHGSRLPSSARQGAPRRRSVKKAPMRAARQSSLDL